MPLLGSAAMLLSFDVDTQAIEEHDRWHTHEHLPERLAIPGFRRGTRWIATEGAPRYMVLYEVADLQTLASQAYLERLDHPTPWTTRIMPHYRGMTRGLCAVLGSFGHGHGGTAALIRFDHEQPSAEGLRRWLLQDVLPTVAQTPGLGAAHLLESTQAAAMTREQRIRGADRSLGSAIIVTGYDSSRIAAFARGLCADDGLPSRGAGAVTSALYGLHYSLDSLEVGA